MAKEPVFRKQTNIKDDILKLYQKIRYKAREKFTIMVVPHNQKGVRNINIPKGLLVAIILSVMAITSFSLVTITKYAILTVKQNQYISENEKMISELEGLIYNSDSLINVQKNFSLSLNTLLKTAGLQNEIFFNETGIGGPLLDANEAKEMVAQDPALDKEKEISNDYIFSQIEEIKDLTKMEKEIGVINKKITKLSDKLKFFEKVTRYIPSIWPIMGDGVITDSNETRITISSLPFTPVVSTATGKITSISFEDNRISVIIAHKYQFFSSYSNLYSLETDIKEGETVQKGQIIGYIAKSSGQTSFDYSIFIGNGSGKSYVNPVEFTYLGR